MTFLQEEGLVLVVHQESDSVFHGLVAAQTVVFVVALAIAQAEIIAENDLTAPCRTGHALALVID